MCSCLLKILCLEFDLKIIFCIDFRTQSYSVNKIDEEDQSPHSSNNEDGDGEASEDEKPTNNRSYIYTSTIHS